MLQRAHRPLTEEEKGNQWRGQNAEKNTHIKGRLLYQATILCNNVPFQNGNFS